MTLSQIILIQYPGLARGTTMSPPCGKVQMALRYKGLEYQIQNVRAPRDVRRYNRRGRVPVLLIDGEATVDSTDILTELERRFPDPPLEPLDPMERVQAKILEDWADEVLYFYAVYLRWCVPENFARLRERVFSRAAAPMRWIIPPLALRLVRKRLIGQGTFLKGTDVVRREYGECLAAVRALLQRREWLVGSRMSRADLAVAAVYDQMALESITPREATELRAIPEIAAWLDRIYAVSGSAARPDSGV